MATSHYPGARAVLPSNDLTRPAGKAASSQGEKLLITGQLLDRHCVPLQGVPIELWQANAYGNWQWASAEERVNAVSIFSGAGRTSTDNNGNFQFITVFPGAAKNTAPRVFVRAHLRDAPPFATALFFGDDARNASDRTFMRLSETARQAVTMRMQPWREGYLAQATLVVPASAAYRSY